MILYRLSRKAHGEKLTGKGAELYGGRWNSKGIPVIYCSSSRALAVTEIISYTPPGLIPEGYLLNIIEIPYDPSSECFANNQNLSTDWKKYPHKNETKQLGDAFLQSNKCLVVRVPSALVDEE